LLCAASYFAVRDYIGQPSAYSIDDVTEDRVLSAIASQVCSDMFGEGKQVEWPNPNAVIAYSEWPDDYPLAIRDETNNRWSSMSEMEKRNYRSDIAGENDVRLRDVDDDWAKAVLVDDLCNAHIARGETIDWPDVDSLAEYGSYPEDYPEDVRAESIARWGALSESEQMDFRTDMLERANTTQGIHSAGGQSMVNQVFIDSFMSPFDLLFMFLAVITAYKIAGSEN